MGIANKLCCFCQFTLSSKRWFLFIAFFLFGSMMHAQDIPSKPANGFSFPLGCKFTIKLTAIDSVNFNYSVIAFEEFRKTIHTFEHDSLFSVRGQDSTVEFYFTLGTHGNSPEEKKKNMRVLLVMKNYSGIKLKYNSEIQRTEDGEFETTSNVGIYPKAKGTEMWPYRILAIGLNSFRKK